MSKLYLSVAAAVLALAITPVQASEEVVGGHDAPVIAPEVKELHETSEPATQAQIEKSVAKIKKHMEILKGLSVGHPSKSIVDSAAQVVAEHTTKAEEHLEKAATAETKGDEKAATVETNMAEEHAHAATAVTAATDAAHTSADAHKDESKSGEPAVHQDVDQAMQKAEQISETVKQEETAHAKAPKDAAHYKAKLKELKSKVKALVGSVSKTKSKEADAAKAAS